jgi:hypothetical protein
MKKTRALALLFLLWVEGSGQSVDYFAELNQPALWGDARYNSLSGAMTAMSGSFTALAENPAGAGLYRQAAFGSDLSIYSTTTFKKSNQFPTGNAFTLNLANLGYVGTEPETGWNVFFTYNSDDLFRQNLRYTQTGEGSIQQQWIENSNYVVPDDLPWVGPYEDMLYQSYASDRNDTTGEYYSTANLNNTDFVHDLHRTGMKNQWTLGFGAAANKQLYYGASFKIVHSYEKVTVAHEERYSETTDLTSLDVLDDWDNSGIGITANAGLLYRPTQTLRLGLAIDLPQVYSFTQNWNTEMIASRSSVNRIISQAEGYGLRYEWSMMTAPKIKSGLTLVGGRLGLITLSHTYIPHRFSAALSREERYINQIVDEELEDQHTLAAGAELRLGPITLRGGSGYTKAFQQGGDAQWRRSLGISLQSEGNTFFMSWSQLRQSTQYFPFSAAYTEALAITRQRSILSIGSTWKF